MAPLGYTPLVLTASAQSGIRTVADLKSFVDRNRSGVAFAASAMETRLGAEMLLQLLNAKSQIVNYKGTGPAMTDIAGGHVPLFLTTFTSVLPFKDTGKVHMIGIAAKTQALSCPMCQRWPNKAYPLKRASGMALLRPPAHPCHHRPAEQGDRACGSNTRIQSQTEGAMDRSDVRKPSGV